MKNIAKIFTLFLIFTIILSKPPVSIYGDDACGGSCIPENECIPPRHYNTSEGCASDNVCCIGLGSTSETGFGCGGGFGPIAEFVCGLTSTSKAAVGNKLNSVIGSIIGFLTIVAGLWFLFQFITAGYQWISAGGDKNNTEAARNKITNSLIGLIIVVGAWIIIGLIGRLVGLDILNPGQVIQNLGL